MARQSRMLDFPAPLIPMTTVGSVSSNSSVNSLIPRNEVILRHFTLIARYPPESDEMLVGSNSYNGGNSTIFTPIPFSKQVSTIKPPSIRTIALEF